MVTATSTRPISPKQVALITKLTQERDYYGLLNTVTALAVADIASGGEGYSTRDASRIIDVMFSVNAPQRKIGAVVEPQNTVPEGRYAVELDGKLGFFKVDCPTEGKWAGRVFVKEQASDEEYPVRGARRDLVLELIGRDVLAASVAYGREIGRCGVCGRTLTDENSRAAGIGPVCAGKF